MMSKWENNRNKHLLTKRDYLVKRLMSTPMKKSGNGYEHK